MKNVGVHGRIIRSWFDCGTGRTWSAGADAAAHPDGQGRGHSSGGPSPRKCENEGPDPPIEQRDETQDGVVAYEDAPIL